MAVFRDHLLRCEGVGSGAVLGDAWGTAGTRNVVKMGKSPANPGNPAVSPKKKRPLQGKYGVRSPV